MNFLLLELKTRLLVETYLSVNWWEHNFLSYLFNELDTSISCGSIIIFCLFVYLFSLEEWGFSLFILDTYLLV